MTDDRKVIGLMLDCGGPDYVIATPKGDVRFEWHSYCGPMPVTREGAGRDLPPRHPFWRIVSLWNVQGQRVKGGRCVWHEPKKPVMKHIAGRHYWCVEPGEVGHDW